MTDLRFLDGVMRVLPGCAGVELKALTLEGLVSFAVSRSALAQLAGCSGTKLAVDDLFDLFQEHEPALQRAADRAFVRHGLRGKVMELTTEDLV